VAERVDRIELRGLRFDAVHGLLPEERRKKQPFEVDIELELDLGAAGRSDDLHDTVDYGSVTAAVAGVMNGPPANLLEHLADQIAAAAIDASGRPDVAVTVTVRKLLPPVPEDLGFAAVRVTRRGPSGS
jgi:dihydroneopterin aldolase